MRDNLTCFHGHALQQEPAALEKASTELMLATQLLENLNMFVKRFERERALIEEQRQELEWLRQEGVEAEEEQLEEAVQLQQVSSLVRCCARCDKQREWHMA